MVINVANRRRRSALPRSPVISSGEAPWQGLRVEQYDGGPFEMADDAPVNHLILVQLDQPTTFQWRRGGKSGAAYVAPRHVSLFPSMAPVTFRNDDTRGFVCVSLEPTLCFARPMIWSSTTGSSLLPGRAWMIPLCAARRWLCVRRSKPVILAGGFTGNSLAMRWPFTW